jgi:EmrB/QacA subfamily drug resistance transporter
MMLATLLAALDQTIIVTALPRISSELNGFDGISWVVTAYLLSSTVTIPLYGRLSDVYGRRRLLAVAVTLFTIGSACCAAAESLPTLIAARTVQGLGAGGLLPLSQAAIADLFSPRERGRYQGYIGAMYAIAAISGPLLGGTLTDLGSWRWIFVINLPLGLFALLVVLRTMPDAAKRMHQRIDTVGAVLLSAGAATLLVACASAGTAAGIGSLRVQALAAVGGLLLAAFVAWERRISEPLIPLDLLGTPVIANTYAAAVVLGAIVLGVDVYVPVFAQAVLGSSATVSGLVLMPLSLAWVFSSAFTGRRMARTGRYRHFPIAGSLLVLTGVGLLATLAPSSPHWLIALAVFLIGLGMGSSWPIYVIATQNAVEHAQIGVATAGIVFCRTMGGSLGVAVLGSVFAARLSTELSQAPGADAAELDVARLLERGTADLAAAGTALDSSVHVVFLLLLPLAVASLILALRLDEQPLRTGHASPPDETPL